MEFSEIRFKVILIHLIIFLLIKRVTSRLLSSNSIILENFSSISDFSSTKSTNQDQDTCIRLICKYICFNGNHETIETDVNTVDDKECEFISELHLFNYQFPRKILPQKLLGSISDRVNHLSIYSSEVEHIDEGAFESKTLTGVHLENLQLKYIDKRIFKNVNEQFSVFTLIQVNPELERVNDNFLEHIKYQIKKLTIQTGLWGVSNLTVSQYPLNSLEVVDLSHNNFEERLTAKSFNQLSVVEKLNLTHSAITFLPENIFMDIVKTLRLLDLSNNKLKFISQGIFGWRSLTKGLNLYLNENPWQCSCALQKEMTGLLTFQDKKVYCGNSERVSVTSKRWCPLFERTTTTTTTTEYSIQTSQKGTVESTINNKVVSVEPIQTTEMAVPPDASGYNTYATTHELECHKDNRKLETENLSIHWPNTQFDIVRKKGSEVDIVVTTNLNGTYGVLWFSKVTLQYYKMETNHNEYGLGCYGRLERVTTVNHLLPDMSYTFCLILKDHLTVSPFSCKSVHMDGNLDIKYNAWLTTNMKTTGISVLVIGIVLFKFLGIFLIFVILKRKPSLLKGSKRVATQRSDATNIIVFPEDKTLQKFKLVEEQLANRKLRMLPFKRLSSVSLNSLESIQSYMNPDNINLYEIIPAHQTSPDVRYAEIPFKRKRSSNDPLPAIPDKMEEKGLSYLAKVRLEQSYEREASIYI